MIVTCLKPYMYIYMFGTCSCLKTYVEEELFQAKSDLYYIPYQYSFYPKGPVPFLANRSILKDNKTVA